MANGARLHLPDEYGTGIDRTISRPRKVARAAFASSRGGAVAVGVCSNRHNCRSECCRFALMASLLAFDTSCERIHVGVSARGSVWLAEDAGGAQASASLLPCVRRLLREAGVGLRQLDAIAFGRGPGAFTGLRAACSAAQGLAWGAGLPVLPIDTLVAVAEDARVRVGAVDVWVAMDARMGELYAARYRWSGGGWITLVPPALVAPDRLHAQFLAHPAAWLVGSAPLGEQRHHPSATVDADARPSARALLACAEAAWARGEAISAAAALPLYLRNKVAFTTAERMATAGSAA
jgi:tRNA threonylcarbamoyladenosine biosynthesis protein TsaB